MFRRVLELDATNATARMALAAAETEKGNYARSLELARPALADFKESPEGLFILATDYVKTGDRAKAARLAEDWKRLPDVPHAGSVRVAELLATGGLVAEAIGILEHAQKAGPPAYELAFGNAPRRDGNARGFAVFNEDINVSKSFQLSERARMRFEVQFGNLFNRTTFLGPNTNWSSGAFGLVSGQANQARSIQLGLRLDY